MYYYANFDRADDGITVTFRDIPEAITCGHSDAEAIDESVYAKVLLHNVMLEKGLNKAELARKADLTPPEVQRLLKPRHKTKIDTIGLALSALGKPLQLAV